MYGPPPECKRFEVGEATVHVNVIGLSKRSVFSTAIKLPRVVGADVDSVVRRAAFFAANIGITKSVCEPVVFLQNLS